ncbi:lantibiotic dehydratase [Chondromyces crocatus]|uniref:Lantibiotic dehydratase N-terminal domain-containing protein n=1 Tax=Chondromyces crocatus TaxID=52 RepID=A0A0K1EJE7_CHOCO|nr:lantibiotic dehydratase [Chondromyces crocatus]AKT40985.1 uncharacterized protein CMC5_051420 [Chondromyces crocatus]
MSPSSPPAPRAPFSAQWFPLVLLRVPGVPRSHLATLGYHATLTQRRAALAARAPLETAARALADRLHPLVPRVDDRHARRPLLAARRALFKLEPLPEGAWRDTVRALDPALHDDLEAWRLQHATHITHLDRCDALFDEDAATSDRALWELLASKHLVAGLALLNPSLSAHLARIPRCPLAELGVDDRKAIVQAFRYLLRAAMKPTPNGHLAGTFLAQIAPTPAPPPQDLGMRTTEFQLSRLVTDRLASVLLEKPAFRDHVSAHVSPCAFEEDGVVWVLHTDPETGRERYQEVPEASALLPHLDQASWGCPSPCAHWGEKLTRATRDRLIETGFLQLSWTLTEETTADDLHAIAQALHPSTEEAPELRPWLAFSQAIQQPLSDLQNAETDEQRHAALGTLHSLLAPDPEQSTEGKTPLLGFDDAAGDARLHVPEHDLAPFLAEVALYGAGYLLPALLPEEQALLALHHQLYPDAPSAPLLHFHRDYLRFCEAKRLGRNHFANLRSLGKHLDLPATDDPAAPFHQGLLDAITRAERGEAHYRPDLSALSRWDTATRTRESLRFAPAPPGPAGPRFHLTLWGGDRMSLFPRYLRRFPSTALTEPFRAWMAQWPAVVDMYGAFNKNPDLRPLTTARALHIPGCPAPVASPSAAFIEPRALDVTRATGRLTLVERATGRPVDPVFLGVSGPHTRPGFAQFLDHLSGHRTSLLELLFRALNRIVGERIQRASAQVERLPAIVLGDHVLLASELFLVPVASLPLPRGPVDRAAFFRFHDWLADHGLPLRAQVRVNQRDPLWLDLAHPAGIQNLARLVHGHTVCLVSPPLLDDDALWLRGLDGSYEVELGAEFIAGTAI